jgi:hypothetical protein
MQDDSKAVKGKTFDKQNNKEKAKKKESFKLVQEPEWYTTGEHKGTDGTTDYYLQPCLAKLDMGKKMEETDSFFATYNVDMGVRIYPNDTAKEYISIPQKTSTVEIKMPNTNLAELYEEQQPETSAETVEYFNEVFKFFLKDYLSDPANEQKGFQRARGGYKLYGDAGAKDRWFFNLALELPTEQFVTGNILY